MKEKRERVCGRFLVELGVEVSRTTFAIIKRGEKERIQLCEKRIARIRRRAKAKTGDVLKLIRAVSIPVRAVINEALVFSLAPEPPARLWREKEPASIRKECKIAILTRPVPGRAGGDGVQRQN